MIREHWNLLAINEFKYLIAKKQYFDEIKELMGSNKTEKDGAKKRQIQRLKPSKCSPCLANLRSL